MLRKGAFYIPFLVVLAMVAVFTVQAVPLDEYNTDLQGILYTLDGSTASAMVGDGSNNYCNSGYSGDGHVVIPSTVEKDGVTYNVNRIGYYAFKRCDNLISVEIPSSVSVIENCAFFDCTNLTSVRFSQGLEEIGDSAFAGCVLLDDVKIPQGVVKIGYSAFYSCKAMTSAEIPEGIEKIGNRAFACNDSLERVIIPDSVRVVDDAAFNSCTALRSVVLPLTLTQLGRSVFGSCTALESVFVGKNVSDIEKFAFWGCDNLTVYPQQEGTAMVEYLELNDIDYILKGDIDGSREVNINDYIYLMQQLARHGSGAYEDKASAAADCLRNDSLDINDAIRLAQYLQNRDIINLD